MDSGAISTSSSNKDPISVLQKHLDDLEYQKIDERERLERIAQLISYLHRLSSKFTSSYVKMYNIAGKLDRVLPSITPYPQPYLMSQYSSVLKAYPEMSSLLYQVAGQVPECTEFFRNSHDLFNQMVIIRNNTYFESSHFLPYQSSVITVKKPKSGGRKPYSPIINKLSGCLTHSSKGYSLDDTFIPTPDAMYYIQEHLMPDINESTLEELHNDLMRTHKELLTELANTSMEKSLFDDFISFPSLNVMSENQMFQKYLDSFEYTSNELRTQLIKTKKAMDSTSTQIQQLTEQFYQCYALPQLNLELAKQLSEKETEINLAQRKVLYFKLTIQTAKIKNPFEWHAIKFMNGMRSLMDHMLISAKNKNWEDVRKDIEDGLNRCATNEQPIKDEQEAALKNSNRASENLTSWLKSNNGGDTSAVLYEQLEEARKKSNQQATEIEFIKNECNRKLSDALDKHIQTVKMISDDPFIPFNFDEVAHSMVTRNAKKEWLKSRLQAKKKELAEKKTRLAKINQENDKVNEEIKVQIDQFEKLKEKSKTSEPTTVTQNEMFIDLKNSYYCSLCNDNKRRRAYLTSCGHTFCTKCLNKCIKTRNRRCPACKKPFAQSEFRKIVNW